MRGLEPLLGAITNTDIAYTPFMGSEESYHLFLVITNLPYSHEYHSEYTHPLPLSVILHNEEQTLNMGFTRIPAG